MPDKEDNVLTFVSSTASDGHFVFVNTSYDTLTVTFEEERTSRMPCLWRGNDDTQA